MQLFYLIRKAKKPHWSDALKWISLILFGGTLPIWGTAILIILFARWSGATPFLARGELYIFSAGILSTNLYTLIKVFRLNVFTVLSIIFLCTASILFAGTVSIDLLMEKQFLIDLDFLIYSSIVISFLSIVISFFTKLGDNSRSDMDISAEFKDQERDFEKKYEKGGG